MAKTKTTAQKKFDDLVNDHFPRVEAAFLGMLEDAERMLARKKAHSEVVGPVLDRPCDAAPSEEERLAFEKYQAERVARANLCELAGDLYARACVAEKAWHEGQTTRLASLAEGALRCAAAFLAAAPKAPEAPRSIFGRCFE